MGNFQTFFKNLDNERLKNENNRLKGQNALFLKTLNKLKGELTLLQNKPSLNPESIEALENKLYVSLENLVNNILDNNSDNSGIIPDFIETKIYTNVFTIVIGIMKEIIEDTNINVLNEKFTFNTKANNLENIYKI